MKKVYYLCCFVCAMLYHNAAQTYFSPYHTGTPYIEKNQTQSSAGPKSSYQKYAAVQFIAKTSKITLDSNSTDLDINPIKNADCPSGYEWVNGICEKPCDRSLYPFSTQPSITAGVFVSCISKGETYYGYQSCNTGWELVGADCVMANCDGYPFDNAPDSTVGTVVSKQCGENIKYKYSACNAGWKGPSNGSCSINECSIDDYPYTSDPGTAAGIQREKCKTGTEYRYGYSSCNEGWDKTGSMCVTHTCNGFSLTSQGVPHGVSYSTCQSGTTTFYRLDACDSDYEVSNGTCVAKCPYDMTHLHPNCASAPSCSKQGVTYYDYWSCSFCKPGYEVLEEYGEFEAVVCCLPDHSLDYGVCMPRCKYAQAGCYACTDGSFVPGYFNTGHCGAGNTKGLVYDVNKRLMLNKNYTYLENTWQGANDFCNNLAENGVQWRLPSKDEMQGMIDNGPIISKVLGVNAHFYDREYWSSTLQSHNDFEDEMWTLDMSTQSFSSAGTANDYRHFYCVANY